MSASLRGHAGEVRWAWHVAATLGSWSLESTRPERSTLTADVQSADDYRISQRPVVFVVPKANGRDWRWPIEALQVTGSTLTATLGPCEE